MISKYFIFQVLLFLSFYISAQEVAGNGPNEKGVDIEKPAEPTAVELSEQANKLLMNKKFTDALPVWLKVIEKQPQNSNAYFKAGLCYRQSFDKKLQALPYFKKSVQSTTVSYNFTSTKENSAPADALYMLGESYLQHRKPDSALIYLTQYRDIYNGNPPLDVDRLILNCMNFKAAKNRPRDVTLIKLGGGVNTNFAESHPVVTMDNSIMLYSSRRIRQDNSNEKMVDESTGALYEDIYIAKKNEQGKFANAGVFKLTADGTEAPLCFSADGLTLYLRKNVKGNNDLYMSRFDDGVWSDPVKLGGGMNSSFDENGMSISGDGKYLYFSSDRPGGSGGFDIYRCVKQENGKWSSPENLGPTVNTPYHEKYPFIHPNGKTLFFSSDGFSGGLGGLDIYFSELKKDNSWEMPQNIGYPINSSLDDINYYIISGGIRFYASLDPDNSYELYQIKGGGYEIENIEASEVVTLTQEMDVTEVMEVVEEKEVEVEVVETVEKVVTEQEEVEVVDLTALDELEKQIDEASTEQAKAEAEKAMAEAEKARAEAEIKKAEAEIAAAEKAKAEAEILKAQADMERMATEKAKAEAEILKTKADLERLATEKAKAEAETQKAEALIAETEKKKAEAEIKRAEAEKAKAERQEARLERKTAREERRLAKQQAKIAKREARKKEAEARIAEREAKRAEKARAEAAEAEAEAEKAKAEKAIAGAEAKKAKADAERKKAEAEIKRSEAAIRKAEAQKAKQAAKKAKWEYKQNKRKGKSEEGNKNRQDQE